MTSARVDEQKIASNGIEIHVACTGHPDAPPLLMIHGIHDEWESWSLVIERFSQDFQLIIPDLRGHGRSSKPDTGYEVSDYAADMAGVIRALELEQAFVVGHSLGALTSIFLGADYPDLVRGLLLEDPPTEFQPGTRERMQPLLEAKRGSDDDAYNLFRERYPQYDEERWRDQARRLRNTSDGPFEAVINWGEGDDAPQIFDALERIQSPALMLQADPMAGAALSDEAAEKAILCLMHGELRKFDDTGHSIHKERPDEFADVALEFLCRIT